MTEQNQIAKIQKLKQEFVSKIFNICTEAEQKLATVKE